MIDYEEMINMKWPQPTVRPRMSLEQRAKIFLPFSALRGYEESLENERRVTVSRSKISDDKKERINKTLSLISDNLENKILTKISAVCFIQDENSDEGIYDEIEGAVNKLRQEESKIIINGQEILFDDIFELRIDN